MQLGVRGHLVGIQNSTSVSGSGRYKEGHAISADGVAPSMRPMPSRLNRLRMAQTLHCLSLLFLPLAPLLYSDPQHTRKRTTHRSGSIFVRDLLVWYRENWMPECNADGGKGNCTRTHGRRRSRHRTRIRIRLHAQGSSPKHVLFPGRGRRPQWGRTPQNDKSGRSAYTITSRLRDVSSGRPPKRPKG